jgi:Spy/CpxP family protein refolding chaperone
MKRLMTLVLAALLSLGVASVSLAQEPAGDQPFATPGAEHGKAPKKHKKKHHKQKHHKKSHRRARRTPAAADEVN